MVGTYQGFGVGGVACFQLSRELESVFKTAGVGVVFFLNCWSRSRVFKTAGVGVGFLKLLESESVFQNCWTPQPWYLSEEFTLVKKKLILESSL